SSALAGFLPRADELRAIYGRSGFEVLGVALGGEAKAPDGAAFPVGAAGEGADAWGSGDGARAYLVGNDGKIKWEGEPAKVPDSILAKEVKKAKPFALAKVDDAAKAAAAAFRKGDLLEAENLALAAEGDGSALVAARVDAIREYWVRDAAAALEAGDYVRAKERLKSLTVKFSGTPAGDEAAAKKKELEADPKAKKDEASYKAWSRLYTDRVRAGGKDKKQKALVKKIDSYLKKHAGTRCAAYALAMKKGILGDPAIESIRAFIGTKKISTRTEGWRNGLPKPPKATFTAGRKYFWELSTNKGDIRIRLLADVAPMHVSSTIYLTELGYYDGLVFHRVIPKFMAQGGCPKGDGTGDPGYAYDGEFDSSARHDRPGVLSMANRGAGTDGSQFFLTFVPYPSLDDKHTVFGYVVEGMETLKKLEACGGPAPAGKPTEPLSIRKAKVTFE
ncbi:MAG: peptidylprolyl isomerase, partial [Planctomycetota bacterium]